MASGAERSAMTTFGCCSALAARIPAMAMSDLPELTRRVEEIQVDAMKWITTYRCKVCGCIWEERFQAEGHGEVPELVRRPASACS
jgi:hypothetical protein